MPRFIALPALCLLLAATAARAAPDTYALPEPTAQFKAPPDGGHAAGFQAA